MSSSGRPGQMKQQCCLVLSGVHGTRGRTEATKKEPCFPCGPSANVPVFVRVYHDENISTTMSIIHVFQPIAAPCFFGSRPISAKACVWPTRGLPGLVRSSVM